MLEVLYYDQVAKYVLLMSNLRSNFIHFLVVFFPEICCNLVIFLIISL